MNTTFQIGGCYEVEITSDGSLHYKDENMSGGNSGGGIGLMVHYTDTLTPAPATTRVAVQLKKNQARALASALLCAVSEAR